MTEDPLLGVVGWPITLLYADLAAFDRWLWVRRQMRGGPVRTLDAGSGNGTFAMYAAKRGNEVLALSDSEADQTKAQRRAAALEIDRIEFRVRDLRRLDSYAAELGQFDQILCLEVIEHILDDAKLLRDFAALLQPGGQLLLTTPYRHHIPFHDEVMSGREDGHHVRWGYTHEQMAGLLGNAGLRPTALGYLSGAMSQYVNNLMQRLDHVYPHLGWGVTMPLRLLRPLDRPVTRLTDRPSLCISVAAVRA